MKELINSSTKKMRRIFAAMLLTLLALSCIGVIFAAGAVLYARSNINANTIELNATTSFTYGESEQKLTFTAPGDQKVITIGTTNSTASVLSMTYTLGVKTTDGNTITEKSDEDYLTSAILVYLGKNYDSATKTAKGGKEYLGTLAELTDGQNAELTDGQNDDIAGSYIFSCENSDKANKPQITDAVILELHLAASDSVYKGKSLTLTTTAYTENADYENNLFVSSAADFTAAINDLNSGLLTGENVKIVLLNDVAAAGDEIKCSAPVTIDLNGYTLSGSLTIVNASSYIWFEGEGTNSASVTLTSCNTDEVKTKLKDAAEEALAKGIVAGSTCDVFGNNKFYAPTVDSTAASTLSDGKTAAYEYNQPKGVTANSGITRSSVESITVCDTAIEFQVFDTDHYLDDKYLAHLPSSTNVTSNLFLPTSVTIEGATIEWTSSDESIMDNTGKITTGKADKLPITLYAAITVNGVTYTKEFSFTVSAHTNEVNFYKMVAAMSPITIYETNSGTYGGTDATGYYELPVVTENNEGDYDYTNGYKTPSKSSLWDKITEESDDDGLKRYWAHTAYSNINLIELTYSDVEEADGSLAYSYITVQDSTADGKGYQVYLNTAGFATYAQINIAGEFSNGDSYTSKVTVIIASGTDTTIYDQAFNSARTYLSEANVLKNILATRVENGVDEEEAYIYMPATLTSGGNQTVTMTYEKSDSDANHVVVSVSDSAGYKNDDGEACYKITLDPEKFSDIEATVPITVIADWSGTKRQTTLTFVIPAAVHTSDLGGDASLFNSIKYQVYQQLPKSDTEGENEQLDIDEAFTVSNSNSTVTNNTGDYILLRDIVGDSEYLKSYALFDYIEDDNSINYYYTSTSKYTTGSDLYEGCRELWFYTTANDSAYTDSYARDFAALINWATGSAEGVKASDVLTNNEKVNNTDLDSTTFAYTSDGNEYLTDKEVKVLKAYYIAATDKNESDWTALWNSVAEYADGYVMTNGSAVESKASELMKENTDKDLYFKYTGVMEWATNFKNNTYNVDGKNEYKSGTWASSPSGSTTYSGVTGNPEYIQYNLVFTTDSNAPDTIYVTWKTAGGTAAKSETNYSYTKIATIDGVTWYYGTYNSSGAMYLRYNIEGYASGGEIVAYTGENQSGTKITVETLYGRFIENYLDDDTSYITLGEAEVIFAFIYSKLGAAAFKEYVTTFYASAIVPTYFTDVGISALMQSFYSDAVTTNGTGIKVSYDTDSDNHSDTYGFKTAAITVGSNSYENNDAVGSAKTLSYTSNGVKYSPAVTNLDNLNTGLHYFTELTALYVFGSGSGKTSSSDSDTLPAFLSEYELSQAISRLRVVTTDSSEKSGITTLVLQHVADNNVSFSLSNIKYFDNLTQIDVSDNAGVTNVNPLVNYNSDKYIYADFSKTSVTSEFYQYALNNLGSTSGWIYYGDSRSNVQAGKNAGTISNLSELNNLIAENMYLATEVYDNNGTSQILWRIEDGNKITYVEYAKTSTAENAIDSADTMQSYISPYYYCKEAFTYGGTTYDAGTVLRFSYTSDGTYSVAESVMTEVASSADNAKAAVAAKTTLSGDSLTTTNGEDTKIEDLIAYDGNGNSTTSTTATTTLYTVNGVTFDCIRLKSSDDHSYALYLNVTYTKTTDRAVDSSKTYYTQSTDTKENTVYTKVASPSDDNINTYYEESCSIGVTNDMKTTGTLACIFISGTGTNGNSVPVSTTGNTGDLLNYLNGKLTSGTIGTDMTKLKVKVNGSSEETDITDETKLTDCYIYFPEVGKTITYNSTESDIDVISIAAPSESNNYTSLTNAGFTTFTYEWRSGNNFRVWFKDKISMKVGKTTDKPYTIKTGTKGDNNYYEQIKVVDLYVTDTANNVTTINNVVVFGVDITKTVVPASGSATATGTGYYYDSDNNLVKKAEYTISFNSDEEVTLKTTYKYQFWYMLSGGTKTYVDDGAVQVTDNTNTITVSNIAAALKTKQSLTVDLGAPTSYTWTVIEETSAITITENSGRTSTYYSYVLEAATETLSTQVGRISTSYQYTGSEAATYYVAGESKTGSYTQYDIYTIGVSDGSLIWENIGTTSSDNAMDEILTTANTHFNDLAYGEYYGMYYAYGGESTAAYTNDTIYRIMPNSSNSAFVYVVSNISATTGYYYCSATNSFTYTYTDSDGTTQTQTFTPETVYEITFSKSGSIESISVAKDGNTELTDVKSSLASVNHSDTTYNEDSSVTDTTSTEQTLASGLLLNCFIFQNKSTSNYLFASNASQKLSTVTIADAKKYATGSDKSWMSYEACKVSFLTAEDKNVLDNSAASANTIIGAPGVDKLNCATLSYDASTSAWSLTGGTAYYLYFPYTMRFAGTYSNSKVNAPLTTEQAYYVCKDTENSKYYLCYIDTDTEKKYVITNSSSGISAIELTSSVTSVDSTELWTVCESLKYSTDSNSYVTNNNHGLCLYKYTGEPTKTNGYSSTSNSTTFTEDKDCLTISVTYEDGNTATLRPLAITYTATNTTKHYSKSLYAYTGGAVYSVTYGYTKISPTIEEDSTIWYLTVEGTRVDPENIKSIGDTYIDDELVKTKLFSATAISSSDVTISATGVGSFYNQTYASSDIMSNLASDSWANEGTNVTNSDMVGKIFRLTAGSNSYQANNFVKIGGFYTVYYDEDQGTYSLKAVANVDYNVSSLTTTTTGENKTTTYKARLVNMRMLTVLTKSYEWYGQTGNDAHTGTGGSYSVVITAFLHKKTDETAGTDSLNNTLYVYEDTLRKYQINVVG